MRPVHVPRSLRELFRILACEPGTAIFAGGTDLLVRLRGGAVSPPSLTCIEAVAELARIEDRGDALFLGAGATHARLLGSAAARRHLPVLTAALSVLGSPHIRNMGTIGGNLVTASPAGDTIPPLTVLDAGVEIRSENGSRRVTLDDFITGPGRTVLRPGEILYGLWIPKPASDTIQHFEKVGRRNAQAVAVVSLAVLLNLDADGTVRRARLAWGSVGPKVVASPEIDRFLVGRRLDPQTLGTVAGMVRETVRPIDDLRASADYRRLVAGNLVRRLQVVGRYTKRRVAQAENPEVARP
jgi:CO/xanthine dehydrogenase FAD-binding subunit